MPSKKFWSCIALLVLAIPAASREIRPLSLEQAVEDYGSMEAYIRDGLGITETEIDGLRSELLE